MRSVPTKLSLPAARQRFLELLQAISFGSIEGLVVRGGQPILNPPPVLVYEIKFGAENGPRPATGDSSPNKFRAGVRPMIQTAAALLTSLSVKGSPSSKSVQPRTRRKSGVDPRIFQGAQLRLP